MEYVLGIDGGGTKSHLALFDSDGGLCGMYGWGCLNHEGLPGSFEQLDCELKAFVEKALGRHGLRPAQITHAVFGLAGADTSGQYALITDIIANAGFESFTLCNDAFLGIPAGSPDGCGICAINGTGCTLAAIDHKGARLQIGGIGSYTQDLGGGGHMGARAIGIAYSELFRKGPCTALTPLVMDALGVDKAGFLDALGGDLTGSARADDCNRLIFQAASAGDSVALSLLDEISENYAGSIDCILTDMCFPQDKPVYITLAGSVFVKEKSPLLRDMLAQSVKKRRPGHDVRFGVLEVPPVAGAAIWALEKAGCGGLHSAVCRQITGANAEKL